MDAVVAPDSMMDSRVEEFVSFAVDHGLVDYRVDEEGNFVFYPVCGHDDEVHEEEPVLKVIPPSEPPKRRKKRKVRVRRAVAVGALVTAAVSAATWYLFPSPRYPTLTIDIMKVPAYTRALAALDAECVPVKPLTASCHSPSGISEVDAFVGTGSVIYTFWRSTNEGDCAATSLKVFATNAARAQWVGQYHHSVRASLYNNFAWSGKTVVYGNDTQTVKALSSIGKSRRTADA